MKILLESVVANRKSYCFDSNFKSIIELIFNFNVKN